MTQSNKHSPDVVQNLAVVLSRWQNGNRVQNPNWNHLSKPQQAAYTQQANEALDYVSSLPRQIIVLHPISHLPMQFNSLHEAVEYFDKNISGKR